MENSELIPPGGLTTSLWQQLGATSVVGKMSQGTEDLSDEQKKKVAKDFESVLVGKLLDEMKNTIGDWGFEEDGASEQMQGLFWLHLAKHIGDNGGLGLWKEVYRFMAESEQKGGGEKLNSGF